MPCLYFNSRCYFLVEHPDATVSTVTLQENNTLRIKAVTMTIMSAVDAQAAAAAHKGIRLYLRKDNQDLVLKDDCVVLQGIMYTDVKDDPYKPTIVPVDVEKASKTLKETLDIKTIEQPFIFIAPMYADAMWDISFTHATDAAFRKHPAV